MQYRNMLSKASRDSVQRTQFTHAKGSEQRAAPLHSCIAIGGVGGVEFICAADPTNLAMRNNVVKKLEVVVSGDTKQVVNAAVGEAIEQVICHGIGRCHHAPPPVSILLSIEEVLRLSRFRQKVPWKAIFTDFRSVRAGGHSLV